MTWDWRPIETVFTDVPLIKEPAYRVMLYNGYTVEIGHYDEPVAAVDPLCWANELNILLEPPPFKWAPIEIPMDPKTGFAADSRDVPPYKHKRMPPDGR